MTPIRTESREQPASPKKTDVEARPEATAAICASGIDTASLSDTAGLNRGSMPALIQCLQSSADLLTLQDAELAVLSVSPEGHWTSGVSIGDPCYRVLKQRDRACRGCRVLDSQGFGDIHTEELVAEGETGARIVSCIPYYGDRIKVISTVRTVGQPGPSADTGEFPASRPDDPLVTELLTRLQIHAAERRKAEAALQVAQMELVSERELLQGKSGAIKELLNEVNAREEAIQERIRANIETLALPLLHDLERSVAPEHKSRLLVLRKTLEDIASPLAGSLQLRHPKLTHRELRICSLVRDGLSSKEIAEILGLSAFTVHNHRRRIRRKLGLSGRGASLAAFLRQQ